MKTCSFFLLFITLQLSNCTSKISNKMLELNETVELGFGKTITFTEDDLELTFLEVSDSRCPKKTQCLVAGKAVLSLELRNKSEKESFVLEVKGLCFDENGTCGSQLNALGYQVEVFFLSPYPEKEHPEKSKYKAKVRVSKT